MSVWGIVEDVGGTGNELFRWAPAREHCWQLIWRPADSITDQLPPGFGLPLYLEDTNHGRRIYPGTSLSEFIALSWASGFAILNRLKRLTPGQRSSYRLMWLMYQRAQRTRDHVRRSFRSPRDFVLKCRSRLVAEERDVLPSHLPGQDFASTRKRVDRLIDIGRDALGAAGRANPPLDECLGAGLWEAAKRDPLETRPEQIAALVRDAIFARFDKVATDSADHVKGRLPRIVWKHCAHDRTRFDRWFGGRSSSLAYQLASQKRAEGGKLMQSLVHDVLTQLGWDSYRYVGGCCGLGMQAVAQALKLSTSERGRFGHCYLPQSWAAEIPIFMLAAEHPVLLGAATQALAANPEEPSIVPAFHRLLAYCGEIASNRRAADRRSKRDPAVRSGVELDTHAVDSSLGRRDLSSHDLLEWVCERFPCSCGSTNSLARIDMTRTTKERLGMKFHCQDCDERVERSISCDYLRENSEGIFA
jgi:hypothetical protein